MFAIKSLITKKIGLFMKTFFFLFGNPNFDRNFFLGAPLTEEEEMQYTFSADLVMQIPQRPEKHPLPAPEFSSQQRGRDHFHLLVEVPLLCCY